MQSIRVNWTFGLWKLSICFQVCRGQWCDVCEDTWNQYLHPLASAHTRTVVVEIIACTQTVWLASQWLLQLVICLGSGMHGWLSGGWRTMFLAFVGQFLLGSGLVSGHLSYRNFSNGPLWSLWNFVCVDGAQHIPNLVVDLLDMVFLNFSRKGPSLTFWQCKNSPGLGHSVLA